MPGNVKSNLRLSVWQPKALLSNTLPLHVNYYILYPASLFVPVNHISKVINCRWQPGC